MEELKQMAADFGLKYAEKFNLINRNPLFGLAVAYIYADGFQFGFDYEGTKEDWKKNGGDLAMKYVEEGNAEIMKKDPLLGIGFIIAYRSGVEKGIEERDVVQLDRDEQGNIIGISTNKN